MPTRVMRVIAATALLLTAQTLAAHPLVQWHESTWADFRFGACDDDIYVSHRGDGAVEFVPRYELSQDGFCDVIASGDYEAMMVFFGDTNGFSGRSRTFPATSGGGCDMADLDCDGHSELIHSPWLDSVVTIYWGSDSGPFPNHCQTLRTGSAEAVDVADLDRDGYLDLVVPGEEGTLYVFWGSAAGYSAGNSLQLNFGPWLAYNLEIADLNRDGYPDIVICNQNTTTEPILYMGPNRTYWVEWLPYDPAEGYAHGVTVADLDGNGWLDIVYTGLCNITDAYVYFGSAWGFSTGRRTVLHTDVTYGGSIAYDFNHDGRLDLLFLRGGGTRPGAAKPVIYFNTGGDPWFDDQQTQLVGTTDLRAAGGMVADFNFDGSPDIYVDGRDSAPALRSRVLWGPNWDSATVLPGPPDHHGMFREPGNVYDRRYSSVYRSLVFDAGDRFASGRCSWIAYEPPGAHVAVAFRSGDTPSPDSGWTSYATVPLSGGAIPDVALGHRYVQYRATFTYERLAYLPDLEEINAEFTNPVLDVGVEAILLPAHTIDSGTVVTPRAVVRNYGTQAATFPVQLRIGSFYSDAQTLTLVSGGADTVAFADWSASPRGTHAVKCTTSLPDDSNPDNDADTTSVTVVVRDVGAIRILAPLDSIFRGEIATPQAQVRNFGNTTESFRAVFRIGNRYCDTAQVFNLPPDSGRVIGFPPWIASGNNCEMACSTLLGSDMDHTNDKATDSLRVLLATARVMIAPDHCDSVMPGNCIDYACLVTNLGNAHDVVDLEIERASPAPGWGYELLDQFGVPLPDRNGNGKPDVGSLSPAGGNAQIQLRVTSPANAQQGLSDTAKLWAQSGIDPAVRSCVSVITIVQGRLTSLLVAPDWNDRLSAGQSSDYCLYVMTEGNMATDCRLQIEDCGLQNRVRPRRRKRIHAGVEPYSVEDWGLELLDSTGLEPLTEMVAVRPGQAQHFVVRVKAPDDIPDDLSGQVDSLGRCFIRVIARSGSNLADTAYGVIQVVPGLAIHNYENPFHGSTRFIFSLPHEGVVRLYVYDRAGELIRRLIDSDDHTYGVGVHQLSWNGCNNRGQKLAPGTYPYVLEMSDKDGQHPRRIMKKLMIR